LLTNGGGVARTISAGLVASIVAAVSARNTVPTGMII
jgi:hypothetical protein